MDSWGSDLLCDDVLVEILCRLPEKVVIRLKCVSRAWYVLISNVCVPRISSTAPLSGFLFKAEMLSKFEHSMDYASYAPHDDCGGVGAGFVDSYSRLLPFQHSPNDLLDCCNGLLLFVRGSVPEYYVCNPATKQCVAIPKDPSHMQSFYAALAFDPSQSPHYRVVRFVQSVSDSSISNPPRLEIFFSDTSKWVCHTLQLEPLIYKFKWIKRSVYLDGVLYRLSYSRHLLCFDLKAMNARAIELPEQGRTDHLGFIGASENCFYYSNHDFSRLLIWLLEDRSKAGEWILKHSIRIHDFAEHPLGSYLYKGRLSLWFKPYAFHSNSELIFLGIPSMILSYHPKSNRFGEVCIIGDYKTILAGQYSVFPYSRCLVVLNDFVQRHCGSPSCK